MYYLLKGPSCHCFGFIFVSFKTEHTVGIQRMLFGWRHRWWVIENWGTQDVNFFIGHTASVGILLTAKEMSPTVRDTATHCSSICAREARNLLLYVWEIHNQHRHRNALPLTGLQQCIHVRFILPWVTGDESLPLLCFGGRSDGQNYNSILLVSHLLCFLTDYLRAFFFPQVWVIHFKSCNRNFSTLREASSPEILNLFSGWVFLLRRTR